MTTRKNPFSKTTYQIPDKTAYIMENELHCITDGRDKNGLRWVTKNNKVPCIFFEKIKDTGVTLYILPSGKHFWKTDSLLIHVLNELNLSKYVSNISFRENKKNELRMLNLTWNEANVLLPILVNWAYTSQNSLSKK